MGGMFSTLHHPAGLHVASTPIYFPVRKALGSKEVERTSLRAFLEARCPSLAADFRPAWWLHNGHLQTMYCVTGDFSKVDQVIYNRTLLRLKDGGTIGLDFTAIPPESACTDDTPVVVVLHGLTGGSHESYVRAILAPATAPTEEGGLGYRGVVVNFRGCAGTPITSPQLYSAGHTDDIRQAVMYIANLYPKAPLLGVGFSLGANVLIRYLAEEGENSRITAGCALGCPWNLSKNNEQLEDGWFYKNVYSASMGQNLVNLAMRHAASLAQFPDSPLTQTLPTLATLKRPLIAEFDEAVTRIGGGSSPPFPFPSAEAYYRWGSSDYVLPHVRVPLLAVNAGDDPIVRALPEDAGGNGWVALAVTAGGGHLGWFEPGAGWGGVRRWIRRPVLEWLAAARDVQLEGRRPPRLYDEDGWLREEGRAHLGVQALEGVDRIVGAEGEEGMLQGL